MALRPISVRGGIGILHKPPIASPESAECCPKSQETVHSPASQVTGWATPNTAFATVTWERARYALMHGSGAYKEDYGSAQKARRGELTLSAVLGLARTEASCRQRARRGLSIQIPSAMRATPGIAMTPSPIDPKAPPPRKVRNNRVVSFHNPDEAVQDQGDSCRKDQPRVAENFQQYRHSSFSPLLLGTVLITGPVAVSSQRHEEHRQIRLRCAL